MNKDLKIRSQTIKIMEGNIERIYPVIGCSNDFLDMTQKMQEMKIKIPWDSISVSLSKVWAMESQNPIWRDCFLEPFFIPLTVSVKSVTGDK